MLSIYGEREILGHREIEKRRKQGSSDIVITRAHDIH